MSDYRFNTTDPEVTWGMAITRGVDEQLLKAPKLKDNGLSIDWADGNGTERYHGPKRFESKTYTVPCVIMASSWADFNTKYNAFLDFILAAGEFNFDIVSRNRRWKVSYLDMTTPEKLGSFVSGKVGFRFNLILVDDYPTMRFNRSQ